MAPGGGGNIKVVVRVRPFNGREKERNADCIVQMNGTQTVLTPPPGAEEKSRKGGKSSGAPEGPKTFAFDRSYWSFDKNDPHYAGQGNLFTDLGVPLLDNAFEGYNNCIFAYGQTGSGKSYSMMGYGEEYGVIPLICKDMFARISALQAADPHLTCTVEVSYLEIYNEKVRDLLNPATKGNLKVREHPSTGPYVEDLAKLAVRSFQEIENLMDEGNKARTVAATNMNQTSSRSHAVFTLTVTQKRHDAETTMDSEKVSRISLVDLAGSERATSTGATGARLKEGAEINRSLSTLGRVIAALADVASGKIKVVKKKGSSQVPYRDSVLTWLLKDSLGGNSMTAMIAAISPADINYDETLSTLRYADSAKRIRNHAIVNEDPNARMIRELKEELAQLRSKLGGGAAVGGAGTGAGAGAGAGTAIGAAPGSAGGVTQEVVYPPDTPLDKQLVSIATSEGNVTKVSKAEIVERLNQSEKLYEDLNQTWEEKLQKTEYIHKEREAALEELGISIEKGFVGLSTPKKMPHLVNQSDDPLLTECLVYNIKPGTTTVGHVDTATTAEIRLDGSKILHQHCTFENVDDVVTLVPFEGAAVMVNGLRITEPKRMRSGFRIILGDYHIFRFNHPMEARAERSEQQSLLRQSMTMSQYGSPRRQGSIHERHERTGSKVGSDVFSELDRESRRGSRDFSFIAARSQDQKISDLSDQELESLFDDVKKARAVRRGKSDVDEDSDSHSHASFIPGREKTMSNGTIDDASLETSITRPPTPKREPEKEKEPEAKVANEPVQEVVEPEPDVNHKDNGEHEAQEREVQEREVQELVTQKQKAEEELHAIREELNSQREKFETRIRRMSLMSAPDGSSVLVPLTEREMELAKNALAHWKSRNYVKMAELVLKRASLLKEAQVMSQIMDKHVGFQFAIIDVGNTVPSSYDLVLNGISVDNDDDALEHLKKPCAGVRFIDFQNNVITLWSLDKLQRRVRLMRKMHQYKDRPDYLRHFKLENPFSNSGSPQYTLIADADISLAAVFECRVQDFSIEAISPYTQSVVGILRLSLEPSTAEAPPSTLKFNIVMRDFIGFPEHEGSEVHAQLFVPDLSDGYAGGGSVTTTQMISGFDENPVRFETVHSMTLPLSSPRSLTLKVNLYARVSPMHLEKLISWDQIRDTPEGPPHKRKSPRIAESEFYSEERYDVFARVQILELSEDGEYSPVDVTQNGVLDNGTYLLHQGLQRRIVIYLTHSSTDALPWGDISDLRVGNARLVDSFGNSAHVDDQPTPEITLKFSQPPVVKDNADGTRNICLTAPWDSSIHNSLLFDRVTAEKYRVHMTLRWNLSCRRLRDPIVFELDQGLRIVSRSFVHQKSMFKNFFSPVRIVHSTVGMFSICIRPVSARRAADLWRMNTQNDYVKGEENIINWAPRQVSLVRDFIASQRRRQRVIEINALRGALGNRLFTPHRPKTSRLTMSMVGHSFGQRRETLLRKYVTLWLRKRTDPIDRILVTDHTEPPTNGATNSPNSHRSASATSSEFNDTASSTSSSYNNPFDTPLPPPRPTLLATIQHLPKNPTSLKSGILYTPDDTGTRWVRRFADLRLPYLHIHTVPNYDEVNAINLSKSHVDHNPDFARLLAEGEGMEGSGLPEMRDGPNVFAIYSPENTFLFASRTQAVKIEWILKIDQSYFNSCSPSQVNNNNIQNHQHHQQQHEHHSSSSPSSHARSTSLALSSSSLLENGTEPGSPARSVTSESLALRKASVRDDSPPPKKPARSLTGFFGFS